MITAWRLQRWGLVHVPPSPSVPALSGADLLPGDPSVRVHWVSGAVAHYDAGRRCITVGHRWDRPDGLAAHVLAHETAHAAQPRWRAWLAGQTVRAALAAGLLGAFLGGPIVALLAFGMWDGVWRWPLEADTDRQATDRVVTLLPFGSPADAYRAWGTRLERRHRITLAIETLGWAGVAGSIAAALTMLRL